ncbi:MAG: short-subunit dehydrogenase [Methylophilaceae bacterium]|jgi:short-subunit dehydrogenase
MFFYEEVKTMMKNIQGQYIWVIGASSGIGAELAIALSQEGANVIISARRETELESVYAQLMGANHQMLTFDISDHSQTIAAFKSIKRLDRVVFMAAVYDPSESGRADIDFIQKSLQVNIGGVYNMLDVVAPFLATQGHGQISLCGSVSGYFGLPNAQPYSATKAALVNLAESLYIEYQPKNIDIKLISPGFVSTPMTSKNDFEMPMIINAKTAAQSIIKGLKGGAFEIHFPKRFTLLIKLLRLLPYWLAFKVSGKLIK